MRVPFRWHRRLGIAAAPLALLWVISGLLLSWGDLLALDQKRITAGWLLEWYGIVPPRPDTGWPIGEAWIAQADGRLFLDTSPVGPLEGEVRGALVHGPLILVATERGVLLLDRHGGLVDRMDATSGLPPCIDRLGVTVQGVPAVDCDSVRYVANPSLTQWTPSTDTIGHWSRPSPLPDPLAESLGDAVAGITVERLLIDAHSGRLFGDPGRRLFELLAAFLLLNAITGLNLFKRRREKQRKSVC